MGLWRTIIPRFSLAICIFYATKMLTTDLRRLRIERCDDRKALAEHRRCILHRLNTWPVEFVPVIRIGDRVARCTFLLRNLVDIPYFNFTYGHARDDVAFVLRPIKVTHFSNVLYIAEKPRPVLLKRLSQFLGNAACRVENVTNVVEFVKLTTKRPEKDQPQLIDFAFYEGQLADYQIPTLFFKRGALHRQNNVMICQLQLVFLHLHITEGKIYQHILQIAHQNDYTLIRVDIFDWHSTAYFINLNDWQCKRRYLGGQCERRTHLMYRLISWGASFVL